MRALQRYQVVCEDIRAYVKYKQATLGSSSVQSVLEGTSSNQVLSDLSHLNSVLEDFKESNCVPEKNSPANILHDVCPVCFPKCLPKTPPGSAIILLMRPKLFCTNSFVNLVTFTVLFASMEILNKSAATDEPKTMQPVLL